MLLVAQKVKIKGVLFIMINKARVQNILSKAINCFATQHDVGLEYEHKYIDSNIYQQWIKVFGLKSYLPFELYKGSFIVIDSKNNKNIEVKCLLTPMNDKKFSFQKEFNYKLS